VAADEPHAPQHRVAGAVDRISQVDPTAMSDLPGGFRRLGARGSPTQESGLRAVAVGALLCALAVVGLFLRSLESTHTGKHPAPAPSASASAGAAPSVWVAAPAGVTRRGQIVEIADDGRRVVLDDGGKRTTVQSRAFPRKEAHIGDTLTVTGSVSPDAAGHEVLAVDKMPE